MIRNYSVLRTTLMQPGAGYAQPTQVVPEKVTFDDAAAAVMTDLTRVTAVIILPGDTADEAQRRMIQRGVRLLLVVDQDRKVVGLITATDILGEKPVLAAQERGLRRGEVLVRDIMTPQERLEVLSMADVRSAKVGHIVATLQKAGRQHAIVVDLDANGRQVVRGLYSATQIARQLGAVIQTSEIARTFSEIESMLAR
ncbi:MAG TPA: CBS domain-containing protein [Burkholderiales bacterium]|nr:CBS domain-containing protein [Burkholderiales bacterium]